MLKTFFTIAVLVRFLTAASSSDVGLSKNTFRDLNVASRADPCDPTCYPTWFLDRVEATCSGQVISCIRYFGVSRPGYKCTCTTPSPSPSPSSSPEPECTGYIYENCLPSWRRSYLLRACPLGVVECDRYYARRLRPGYKCKCGAAPTPTSSPSSSPSSSATPSPSSKPDCPGPLFNLCYSRWRYGFLLRECPYGVSECELSYHRIGYQCECVIAPSPSSTPSSSPTPSSTPKYCDGIYYNGCFSSWKQRFLYGYCLYGVETCRRSPFTVGYRCICQ